MLRDYFRSGWAFLIPYLAAYLLYAWMKWPVNPLTEGAGSMEQGARSWVPCLLHVYWSLHILHLVLAARAGIIWCKKHSLISISNQLNPERNIANAVFRGAPDLDRLPLHAMGRFWPIFPAVFIAFLFIIPGIYWEFPSDIWEHYMRINDWIASTDVCSYTGWRKSSYFLAYSIVRQTTAVRQILLLDYYYVTMCLIICWQYYLLIRAIRLTRAEAIVFVIINILLLGNSLFSFYRYYGLASTAQAHIGTLALLRIFLSNLDKSRFLSNNSISLFLILRYVFSLVSLTTLMVFNHPQALGLALLGLSAIVLWKICEGSRSAIIWAIVTAFLVSVTMVCWWPVDQTLHDLYRSSGWLTTWYAFNILTPGSPAFYYSIQILGFFGLLNFIAGLWLLKNNQLTGWLTATPIIALLTPLFALPFANLLSQTSANYILVFSRMLLAIPAGLALVVMFNKALYVYPYIRVRIFGYQSYFSSGYALLLLGLFSFLTVPTRQPFNNRLWSVLSKAPEDLTLRSHIAIFSQSALANFKRVDAPHFITNNGLAFAAHSTGFQTVTFNRRLISQPFLEPPSATTERRMAYLSAPLTRSAVVFVPSVFAPFSPYSISGYISQHWLPQEVILQHNSSTENIANLRRLGARQMLDTKGVLYILDY